jgi:proteasome accessory factor C
MSRADAQLQRLLHAFPLMADEPNLSLETLAQRVGTDATTLLGDFAALDRDDVPAGWVEAIEVHIGPQEVSMRSAHFKRPMRLTRPEIVALELGLGMLAQEVPADEHHTIASVRAKLLLVSTQPVATVVDRRRAPADPPARTARIDVEAAREPEFAPLVVLQHALEHSVAVDLSYHRSDAESPSTRRVRPYAMVRADANIYVVGFCERADAMRVFRLDRVAAAQTTAEHFEIPADFTVDSVLQRGHVFAQEEPAAEELVVRYGPAIARWIAEREGVALDDDGAVQVRYPLADAAWAVRHVLQYGPDAVIVSPDAVRQDVRRALEAMLAP